MPNSMMPAIHVLGCLDTPTEGSLRLDGIEISGLKERDLVRVRRDKIGFVFQQFFLMSALTARENIEHPLIFSHKSSSKSRIDEVLEIVGLSDRADHLPGQLSGGEMQRVVIGSAQINIPKIIMADEPTGNLDSFTAEMIYKLFQELSDQGLTLIIVTHNLDLANLAGKIFTLRDGRIVSCEDKSCKSTIPA